jgi:hypothetical protein
MLVIKNIQGRVRYALEDSDNNEHVETKLEAVPRPVITPNRNHLKTFETWYNENQQFVDEIISCYFAIILQYTQETSYRYAFDQHLFRNLLARVIYKTSDSRYKRFV